MTYTPINWQTGDTITAEKMNKMDNGWGFENTQLFSETVTTVAGQYGNEGQLTYSSLVSSSELPVTFDGVDYQCPLIDVNGYNGYGGVTSEWNYDFSVFPFALVSSSVNGNILGTENAGTHTIAVAAQNIVTSSDFDAAVNSCIPAAPVIECIENETTMNDISGKLAFFKRGSSTYIIVSAGISCTVMPEPSDFTAHFGRDDGLFYITTN